MVGVDFLSVAVLLLALGVVFVNGFTDAPNAIATSVASGALSMKRACAICAIFNVLGLVITAGINRSVADVVFEFAKFGESKSKALIAVFLTVIAFSLVAWLFSMPSSESHALLSSIAGASLATSNEVSLAPFWKITVYMVAFCTLSFFLSALIMISLKGVHLPYKRLQIVSCGASSFMHGAQDGQKFLGILLVLANTSSKNGFFAALIPVSCMLFLGAILGGGRIVKTMSDGIVDLEERSAFVSDLSSSVCLAFCSLLGFAVSTSNIKACSIAGAGLGGSKRIRTRALVKMALVALATFPVCMIFSYLLTKALIRP